MEKFIKMTACRYGADVCGIGSIDRFENAPMGYSPLDLFEQCKSVIAVGIALPEGLYDIAPRLIYSHFNAEVCTILDHVELNLAKEIEKKFHCLAVPVPNKRYYRGTRNLICRRDGVVATRSALCQGVISCRTKGRTKDSV